MMMDSRRFGFDAFPAVAPQLSAFGGNNVMLAASGDGINTFKGGGGRSLLRMNEIGGTGGVGMKRRPYFGTSEELVMEDDYYDELLPEKKRRLTPEQAYLLEKSFETENKLEPERKSELAKRLGLQPRQVAIWFQNRRARWKTKQLEHDFESLKASYNSLLADHDSLLAENQLLRSEVLSLMDKLQAKGTNDPKQQPESTTVTRLNTEEKQSPGSRGSVVVGEEGPQWVVEKCESYYPEPEESNYNTNYAGILHSLEDDGSDDGGGYIPQLEFVDHASILHHQQQPEEEEASIGWWVWS